MPQTKPLVDLISVVNPSGLSSSQLGKRLGRSGPPYTILLPLVASAGTFDIEGTYDDEIGLTTFQPLAGKLLTGATATEWASLAGITALAKALIVIEYPLVAIRASVAALTATGTFRITLVFNE